MRFAILVLLICGLVAGGCQSRTPKAKDSPWKKAAPKKTVIPDTSLYGKVKTVNEKARFLILSFPLGQMPRLEQRLFLYRQGEKVGEVRVTGPQMDVNIAADLVAGTAQAGDEAREY